MEKLAEQLKANGHTYDMIKRTETKAIYEQRTKAGTLAGHEVFKIKISKAGKVFGKQFNERETYPSASDF